MKAIRYIAICAACLALVASCAKDRQPAGPAQDEAVSLSGAGTRSSNNVDLYIKAFAVKEQTGETDFTHAYIPETAILLDGAFPTAPEDDTQERSIRYKNAGEVYYYPINAQYTFSDIAIFSYTGKLNANNEMSLTSAASLNNDAILSNYGYRDEGGATPVLGLDDGKTGTRGSSVKPAKTLQYRHVMTQVNVNVIPIQNDPDYDGDKEVGDIIESEITSITMSLSMATESSHDPGNKVVRGLARTGTYSIFNKAPQSPAAINNGPIDLSDHTLCAKYGGGASYQLKKGVNYVVPTGDDLATMKLTELKVDDYTATAADMADLQVLKKDYPHMYLMPGYSYDLNLVIDNLGIRRIELSLQNWRTSGMNADLSYEPYKLDLNLVNYEGDPVTRVTVYRNGYMYAGSLNDATGKIEFVTMPPVDGKVAAKDARTTDKVVLYTNKGVLYTIDSGVQLINNSNERDISLEFELSKGGMILSDPTQLNSADNPYLVFTPLQFTNIAKEPYAHYRQEKNIDLDDMFNHSFAGFAEEFTGSYDGNDKLLINMKISGTGMFSSIGNTAVLKDINITSGTVNAQGAEFAGGICGRNNGTIIGCINQANIQYGSVMGGIAGQNGTTGKIIGCLNTGKIRMNPVPGETVAIGGIVGDNRNGDMAAVCCINIGKLDSGSGIYAGGVCGSSVAATAQDVFDTCIWLHGSSEENPGKRDIAVGNSDSAGCKDCMSVSDDILLDKETILWNGVAVPLIDILTDRTKQIDIGYCFKYTTKLPWPVFQMQ